MKRNESDQRTLALLQAIEARNDVTQRGLANHLDVALGLTNSYLRRCVRKGLVKIKHAPANRYLYYLTPRGLAEKSRLTAEYLTSSFDFYHRAGGALGDTFATCSLRGYGRLVFAGMSEVTEIASIRLHEHALEVVGTIDLGATVDRFLGRPVWRNVAHAPPCDAVVFTALADPQDLYAALRVVYSAERILVPDLLRPLIAPAPMPGTVTS